MEQAKKQRYASAALRPQAALLSVYPSFISSSQALCQVLLPPSSSLPLIYTCKKIHYEAAKTYPGIKVEIRVARLGT